MSEATVAREDVVTVADLEVTYSRSVRAVAGISLTVAHKEVVAILGPNGAGKTTTLRAIAGFAGHERGRITGGRVTFAGSDVTRLSPERRARLGIGIVPETSKIFDRLTVAEHLRAVTGDPAKRADLLELFPRLAVRSSELAGNLSGGERQMLGIAMTLALDPTLLIIDELSLGLAPKIVDELLTNLVEVRDALQVSVLFVEQNVDKALAVADRCYVVSGGRVIHTADAADLRGRGDVWSLLVGDDVGRRVS